MPIYEYKCEKCGLTTEEFRKVKNADTPPACPCGGETKRIISAPNFKFKRYGENPDKTARRLQGLKRGERTFEDPYAKDGKVVRLADNREVAKQQIIEEVQRNRPEIKKQDINPHL